MRHSMREFHRKGGKQVMKNIIVPDLGMSTAEVDIIKWKVKVGDFIKAGDEIADVESEKANMAIESQYSGVITEILYKEGETVVVGSAICTIEE